MKYTRIMSPTTAAPMHSRWFKKSAPSRDERLAGRATGSYASFTMKGVSLRLSGSNWERWVKLTCFP